MTIQKIRRVASLIQPLTGRFARDDVFLNLQHTFFLNRVSHINQQSNTPRLHVKDIEKGG